MGSSDLRLNQFGQIDQRLRNLLKAMRNVDPPPVRLQPVPMQVMVAAQALADSSPRRRDEAQSTIDMAWIGFFYMLRAGEHCHTCENYPLRGRQIRFARGHKKINPFDCCFDDLANATQSSITFETQKNRQKGEIVAHGLSKHTVACPTRALARRIMHLRQMGGGPNTPLCAIRPHADGWVVVTSKMITDLLRHAVRNVPDCGVEPTNIQTRSLRAGGAMALLCGRVDTDTIKLVGRWRSDAMFRYLHAQATPVLANLANKMLVHGTFTLAPGAEVPEVEAHLLDVAAPFVSSPTFDPEDSAEPVPPSDPADEAAVATVNATTVCAREAHDQPSSSHARPAPNP